MPSSRSRQARLPVCSSTASASPAASSVHNWSRSRRCHCSSLSSSNAGSPANTSPTCCDQRCSTSARKRTSHRARDAKPATQSGVRSALSSTEVSAGSLVPSMLITPPWEEPITRRPSPGKHRWNQRQASTEQSLENQPVSADSPPIADRRSPQPPPRSRARMAPSVESAPGLARRQQWLG